MFVTTASGFPVTLMKLGKCSLESNLGDVKPGGFLLKRTIFQKPERLEDSESCFLLFSGSLEKSRESTARFMLRQNDYTAPGRGHQVHEVK